ncbi:ATP-binding protein [Aquabacterium humicola]|uniref:ATP-binding protein n=1 Tax=Aquabacterium humicola TaxID=3237377 RepID=UPI002542C3D3|nr:AAA family ATPase [Rubrivivax pictus]
MAAVAPREPMLRLQLLGPACLLRDDGRVQHVGTRKALALLALIAFEGAMARSTLSSMLWPDAEAGAARRNLRRELFRLRRVGLGIAESDGGGLALETALAVDALSLLHEGRVPERMGVTMEGLDGVGSPDFDAWLQRWRIRLADRHDEALSAAADSAERGGDLHRALELQGRRWDADPCNERAAIAVMRLQAASGHRAAALAAYARLTAALQAELETAPSPAAQVLAASLRGAEKAPAEPAARPAVAIVRDPVASAPVASAPMPNTGLPVQVPFVPRHAAMQRVLTAWGRGQRVYLHGPAGTGKTRLASELAASRGPWLRVACEPHDALQPWASVVRVLRALRASAPEVDLPEWVRRELAQLMPEWGEPVQALATDEARQRLLGAAAEAWRLLMLDNFSAFVLDDWHWSDAASIELWSRLDSGEAGGGNGVAWIVGYRSAELPRTALERMRSDIDHQRGAAVALEGFAEAEVLALTHALSGAGGGRLFSQRLHRATEGNPFFMLETLRHLFEQGLLFADSGGEGWSTPFDEQTEAYEELPVPPSVRAAVLARVRALGAPVQRVLEAASLLGGEIDARLLASFGEAGAHHAVDDEEAVISALEHARSAQLVHETANGWRFAHDLVRQSLVQGLSGGRRRLLHERLARRLESVGAAPALTAAQWEAAMQPASALPWRLAAAQAALEVHALAEALMHFEQALADGARGADAARIHLACAAVHRRRSDMAAADAAFAAAVAAASERDAAPGAAPADAASAVLDVLGVQLARAEHLCLTDRIPEGLAVLEALAPELAGATPAQRAMALAVRGSGLMRTGRLPEAMAALGDAAALLETLPAQRQELATLLLDLARCSNWHGDLDACERHARRAVAVHESIGNTAGLASALSSLCLLHNVKGEREQALAVGERARALAARSGNVPVHREVNFQLLQAYLDAGETDAVLRLLDEGDALAPAADNRGRTNYQAARFFVHFLRGEVEAARTAAADLLRMSRSQSNTLARIGYLLMVADLHVDLGEWAAVRPLLDEAFAASAAVGDAGWFASNMAIKQATLALAEGRQADALALLPTNVQDEVDVRFHCAYLGSAAARAQGRPDEARRWLDTVAFDDDAPVHPLACWLEQRLMLAAATARADQPALARAEALLAGGSVPVLLRERLRAAVAAAPR